MVKVCTFLNYYIQIGHKNLKKKKDGWLFDWFIDRNASWVSLIWYHKKEKKHHTNVYKSMKNIQIYQKSKNLSNIVLLGMQKIIFLQCIKHNICGSQSL